MDKDKLVSFRINISESVRHKFKSLTAAKGLNMTEIVREMIEKWVEDNDNQ
jgi:predicted DNA-binding protein